jgi:hypothetical protein
MTIKDYQDGKVIYLSTAFDNRAKILNIIYFICFTGAAIGFITIPARDEKTFTFGLIIFIAIATGIYLFAGYRFINKALQSEKLIVKKNTLTISRSGFLSTKSDVYQISQVSNFRHLEKPETTKHPLAGESFDYLGFQAEQQVINEMHGDNRLAFDYNHKTIKFGENMYSWDFEELETILYNITGHHFPATASFEETFELTPDSI